MELKYETGIKIDNAFRGSNRTFMELKYRLALEEHRAK